MQAQSVYLAPVGWRVMAAGSGRKLADAVRKEQECYEAAVAAQEAREAAAKKAEGR